MCRGEKQPRAFPPDSMKRRILMDINIKVKDKIAVGDETLIVCGNSDYIVKFELDAEWEAYDEKTMRIGYRNGKYKDVGFTGTSCSLPIIKKRPWIAIGLYAGKLHTSTPAVFRCAECITDKDDEPEETPGQSPYKTLTIKIGDSVETYEYTGSADKTIEVEDGSGVSY